MPPVSVECPHCGHSYSVEDSFIGRRARCKGCGHAFVLHREGEAAGPPSASGSPSTADSKPSPALPARTLPLPETIGRFVIKRRLGSGAFGTVYLATDPRLGREVALKVPRAGLLQNPKAVERFLREARAAAGLRHPNIVTVLETGIDRGEHYIATEFIDGTTLAAAIGPVGLDPRRAAEVIATLAEALHFAHAQGIVHRDVKPANVMLDKEGQPHLMDFGLARIEGATGEKLTQAGAILGTPAYMAPEQAAGGGAEADAASDQYSLGATLYELLTGRTPFSGKPEVVIYNLAHSDVPPPRSIKPRIPRDLETICLKAMARVSTGRYASCQVLADDLGRWLRGEPIHARRPGKLESVRRWARRHRVAAGFATSFLIGLVMLAALMATSRPRRPEPPRMIPPVVVLSKINPLSPEPMDDRPVEQSPKKDLPLIPAVEGAEAKSAGPESSPAVAPRKAPPPSDPSEKLTYEQRIREAHRASQGGDPVRAETLLDSCPTGSRGWEWYHCKRLCRFFLTTLEGHSGPVNCVAFSPDGERLASGGDDAKVRVWDERGQARATLDGHSKPVVRVAFSPDGSRLISVAQDDTMIEWDAGSGKILDKRSMPLSRMTAADISADARWIAVGNAEGRIKIWDVAGKREEADAGRERSKGIQHLAFGPDDQQILCRTGDGWTLLHRGAAKTPGGKSKHETVARRQDSIGIMMMSPDGRSRATASGDVVSIYDTSARRKVREFAGRSGAVTALAFSRDGMQFAAAGGDTLHIWEMGAGEWITSLQGHVGILTAIRFSPDGRRIAAASRDGKVYVRGISDGLSEKALGLMTFTEYEQFGKKRARLVLARGSVSRISFSADGSRILLHKGSGDTRCAELLNGRCFLYGSVFTGRTLYADFDRAAYCHLGRLLMRAADDGAVLSQVELGNLFTGESTTNLLLSAKEIIPLDPKEIILIDESHIYLTYWYTKDSKTYTRGCGVWDLRVGGWAWWRDLGDQDSFEIRDSCLVRRTGRLVMARGRLNSFPAGAFAIEVRSAATGGLLGQFPGASYQLHPDGDLIATMPPQKDRISVFRMSDGRELGTFPGADCSFSPSGKLLATWAKRDTAVWDLATGRERFPAFSPSSPIAFSPDERRLLATRKDAIVVKETSTGNDLLELPGPTGRFAFSPDGSSIVAADFDRAKIWVADPAEAGPRPE